LSSKNEEFFQTPLLTQKGQKSPAAIRVSPGGFLAKTPFSMVPAFIGGANQARTQTLMLLPTRKSSNDRVGSSRCGNRATCAEKVRAPAGETNRTRLLLQEIANLGQQLLIPCRSSRGWFSHSIDDVTEGAANHHANSKVYNITSE
jgi:hypothetical protein